MSAAPRRPEDPFFNPAAESICRLLRFDVDAHEPLIPASNLERDQLAAGALSLGVGPLVYYRLRELGYLDQVSLDARRALKSSYINSVAASLIRQNSLKKILAAFDRAAIPVISLKGAHLANTVYPDPALRHMSDLDLLVPFEKLEQAVEALQSLGYRPERQYWTDFETTVNQHLPPFRSEKDQTVELHWTIRHPELARPVDLAAVWARAQPFDLEGQAARGLSTEDLLLHLAAHSAIQHHMKGGLQSLYDIAAVVDRWNEQIDWEQLVQASREHKLRKALYLLLRLCRELFGAPVPEAFLLEIQPPDFDPQWLQAASDLIFLSQANHTQLSINYADLVNANGLPGKLYKLLKQVFIPPAQMSQAYGLPPGSARVWLYYPVRFRYLAAKHAQPLKRLARGEAQMTQSAELTSQIKARTDYLDAALSEGMSDG